MSDFDASAAAAEAVSDMADGELEAAQEAHAAAEGVEASPDVGSTRTLREMALSTQPSVSLDQVEDPWDPNRGGTARIMRAVMKATNIDGLPAIADFAIGIAEVVVQIQEELPGGDQESSGDGDVEANPDAGGKTFAGNADSGEEIAAQLEAEGA